MFEFKITANLKDARGRTGEFVTPHGKLQTPELSIVATEGEVKAIPGEMLSSLVIPLVIVNTFHIYTKEILPKIKEAEGIHNFIKTNGIIQSDSGGFQVFSLGFGKSQGVGKIAPIFPGKQAPSSDADNPLTITDKGVTFPFDDRLITLNPKRSIEIQHAIGADIIFAFDECTSPLNTHEYVKQSLYRTHRWLTECLRHHKKSATKQALFGIVQGSYFKDLRKEAVKFMKNQDVPGFGIGGSFGKMREDTFNILDWIIPDLPEEKPRHLLGIGQVRDIFESVERGVDLFDCVIPTREARHKVLYTKRGKVKVNRMRAVNDVIEKECKCMGCVQKITYSQLAELFTLKDPRAFTFSTLHNIQFYTSLTTQIRDSIVNNTFNELKDSYLKYY